MSLRAFYVLVLVLLTIGSAVAPTPGSAPAPPEPKPQPARQKYPGETQEAYAADILKGQSIKEFKSAKLPIPPVNEPKYVLADDTTTVNGFLKVGSFWPKWAETYVDKVEELTAFSLSVQNYWNNLLYCVQRIRVYEEIETPKEFAARLEEEKKNPPAAASTDAEKDQSSKPAGKEKNDKPRRKFKDKPRDDVLVKCEGGYDVKPHTRYRFAWANAIFFYGANRIIFKFDDDTGKPDGSGLECRERSFTVGSPRTRKLDGLQCKNRLDTIFTWKGAVRNIFWNLFNNPLNVLKGRVFEEK